MFVLTLNVKFNIHSHTIFPTQWVHFSLFKYNESWVPRAKSHMQEVLNIAKIF